MIMPWDVVHFFGNVLASGFEKGRVSVLTSLPLVAMIRNQYAAKQSFAPNIIPKQSLGTRVNKK